MDRLIDTDSAYTVLTDYYHHKTDAQHMALKDALDKVETVEAIPVDWIEAEIKKLRAMNFELATMTAGQIEAMMRRWREEQNNGKTD